MDNRGFGVNQWHVLSAEYWRDGLGNGDPSISRRCAGVTSPGGAEGAINGLADRRKRVNDSMVHVAPGSGVARKLSQPGRTQAKARQGEGETEMIIVDEWGNLEAPANKAGLEVAKQAQGVFGALLEVDEIAFDAAIAENLHVSPVIKLYLERMER